MKFKQLLIFAIILFVTALPQSKTYFKNLDALRLFAFLLVFVSHVFVANNREFDALLKYVHHALSAYAYIGISFFFTLSAFLITRIILLEITFHQQFNLKHFFVRRSLRIWPLYFLIILMAYALTKVLEKQGLAIAPLPEWYWFATFTINYYVGYINEHILFFLVFLWTIAVEEQFYLFWGTCMYFFQQRILQLIMMLLLIYLIYSGLYIAGIVHAIYFNPLHYLVNFASGIFLAYAHLNGHRLFQRLGLLPQWFWRLFYILFFFGMFYFRENNIPAWAYILRQAIFAACFLLILFDQCFNPHRLFNAGKNKLVNYFGKISYGLYCWHGVAITAMLKLSYTLQHKETTFTIFIVFPLCCLLFTVALSVISYELFESRFLKLKRYFSASIANSP